VRPGDRLRIGLALLAVYVIWGSTFYAVRVGLDGFPPFLLGGLRFLIAGATLFTALRLNGARGPSAEEWRASAVTGGLLLVGGNGTICFVEETVSSSVAAIVIATMPLWAVLIAALAGERPTRRELVGAGLGFTGVVVLNAGGGLGGDGARAIALVLAPVSWAAGTLASRRMRLPPGAMAPAAQLIVGGVGLLGISAVRGEAIPAAPGLRSTLALGYLVVFGSLIAFRAYGFLLRTTRPAIATSYAYVNPVVAVVLGMAFAGERLRPSTFLGAGIILSALVALSLGAGRRRPAPAVADAKVNVDAPAPSSA
jgi:drug/metabolite transporter (DMT)-like permease